MELKIFLTTFLVIIVTRIVFDTISRKWKSGVKPLLACFIDAICYYPMLFGIGPYKKRGLYMETIINKEKKNLKLYDMGGDEKEMTKRYDPVMDLGFERSKAEISPGGVLFLANSLSKRIQLRLKLIDYVKKHPKVETIPVKRPVFVTGFTRTGTTFLHEMLGLHPDVRSHYTWEQIEFVPRTDEESMEALIEDRKKRYEDNKYEFGFLTTVAGDAIQSIHRIEYDAPEECTTLIAMEVPLNFPTLPFKLFASKEVMDMGAKDAFSLYKKYLQVMSFQAPDRQGPFNWMLKCPFYLPYLTELNEGFPDATIVWTHRNPVECIGSACSLYETIMRIAVNSWTIDKKALGAAVMEYSLLSLEKAIRSIEKAGKNMRIVHVRYADNIKNPKSVCKQVLDMTGIPFTEEYEQLLDDYLAESHRKRKAMKEKKAKEAATNKPVELHSYSLEEYGLSKEIVSKKFESYITKYNL